MNIIEEKTDYRKLALKYHEPKCVICGFSELIEIHHIDRNRQNNEITNLIPLCCNHHRLLHSKKCSDELRESILEYQFDFREQWMEWVEH